jgi:hypothetical protein
MGNKKGSFIKDNIGGLIFSAVLVVVADIIKVSGLDYGAGKYIAISILHIPAVFVAYLIANAVRKAVHPDFVITSGFFGLLKEKIFWRIGPQTILCVLVLILLANLTAASARKSAVQDIAGGVAREVTARGGKGAAQSGFAEITREQFIELHAKGKEFTETDPDRVPTLIRRGTKYLRIQGPVTVKQLQLIFAAAPDETTANSNEGIFLDMSGVTGWYGLTTQDYIDIFKQSSDVVATLVFPDEFTEIPYLASPGGILQNVFIPQTVTKIAPNTFLNRRSLTGVFIPASVTEIGDDAFNGCRSLAYVYFSPNSRLKTIRNAAFANTDALTNFTIPEGVESVGINAVAGGITEIVYPESVRYIGGFSGYEGGEKIQTVIIKAKTPPESIKYGRQGPFEGDEFLKTIKNIYVPAESLKAYEDAWFECEFTFNGQLKAIK